jgi:hypothetical protein
VKLGDLKLELIQEQDSLNKKIKSDVSIKFKSEGNKIQHTFNEEVLEMLQKLYKQLPVEKWTVFPPVSELSACMTHTPSARLMPCNAPTKGRLTLIHLCEYCIRIRLSWWFKIQHIFNEKVLEMLQKLYKQLSVDLS